MSKPLAYSRWRRLPGAHRITEHRLPDPRSELQRVSLFVPGWVLDEAERLAHQGGYESVQEYCEMLLREAIERRTAPPAHPSTEPRFSGRLDLDAIASDLHELTGWSGSRASEDQEQEPEPAQRGLPDHRSEAERPMNPEPSAEVRAAIEVVLRHAGFSDDTRSGLLPGLRRGEPVSPPQAEELLRALVALEKDLQPEPRIERKLAYALHRLAFESQVLLTDAWPSLASDQATLDVLRMVQEAVERVLSGEDIRYYTSESSGEPGS